jgi:hypothetical protein
MKGSYCLSGSRISTPCPRGTYMADFQNDGNKNFSGVNYLCDLCPSGKSCNRIGLLSFDGGIEKGYWSSTGGKSPTPVCTNSYCREMYGLCPTGNYCPVNSSRPLPCEDGFYQDIEGKESCKVMNQYLNSLVLLINNNYRFVQKDIFVLDLLVFLVH